MYIVSKLQMLISFLGNRTARQKTGFRDMKIGQKSCWNCVKPYCEGIKQIKTEIYKVLEIRSEQQIPLEELHIHKIWSSKKVHVPSKVSTLYPRQPSSVHEKHA